MSSPSSPRPCAIPKYCRPSSPAARFLPLNPEPDPPEHTNPVGASLLAMTVGQSTSMLNVLAPSRASSLPQVEYPRKKGTPLVKLHCFVTDTHNPQIRGQQIGETWAAQIGKTVALYLDF